jgi:hypothetical protein
MGEEIASVMLASAGMVSNATTWMSALTQRTTTAIPMRIVSIITVHTAASAERASLGMAEAAETSTSVW